MTRPPTKSTLSSRTHHRCPAHEPAQSKWSAAERTRGLRLRLTCLHGRESCRQSATTHPREMLDRRGMCRGLRGTNAPEQMTRRARLATAVERPRNEHWRGRAWERSDLTARDSAAHRRLTRFWRTLLHARAQRRCFTLRRRSYEHASLKHPRRVGKDVLTVLL